MHGSQAQDWDAIVVGGGLIGSAVAYGLSRRGRRTLVLDGADDALRASRANFGLVWVQGKGLNRPEYAGWSRRASELWPEFCEELNATADSAVPYRRSGGVALALSEDELAQSVANLETLQAQTGANAYPFEVLDHDRLAAMLPGLGPRVVGGTYCPLDGDTNPLKLLRALHTALQRRGGSYHGSQEVIGIAARDGGYRVTTTSGAIYDAAKVVIAAGLGNRKLAALVGLHVPVDPLWGQIIVTERCQPLFDMPTLHLRQTDEGSFLLGVSQRDAGLDTATQASVMRDMAWRNAAMFPFLEGLRIVRTWSGLRVMTPDGFPIYDRSPSHPGVFVVTGHSGVTTAANHALLLARWIDEGDLPQDIAALNSKRFDVQASAA